MLCSGNGSGRERTAGAKAAVTQGSVVVRARLVQAVGLATATARAAKLKARQRLGRENEGC